ncbi:MAG: DoxX family protein, partial [Lautropia sp.]|nr:DoxX family protein [Lautropia sp.]
FFLSGNRKLLPFEGNVGYMSKSGVPMEEVLAALTIVLEIGAAVLLIVGYKARIAALALAVFVAVVTPIFHGYWSVDAAQYGNQFNHFWKNVSIIGGMLAIFANGAGMLSVDGRTGKVLAPGSRAAF